MRAKLVFLVLTAAWTLAACTAPTGPNPALTTPTTTAWPTEVDIHIYAASFKPDSVTIKAGTTVVWTNKSDTLHIVTSDDSSWMSESLDQGQSFKHVFDKPGTYAYHCDIHWFMKGTIIVVP